MITRRALITLLLAAILVPFARGAERPNVLFIAIDDLNDWVGPLRGHPQVKTPHLDRLAARGVVFTNAHCQAPLCNPSRTSLMTGLRPGTTGVYALQPWFRTVDELKDHVTLPQHFKANGYHTYTTGKIYHGGYPPKPQQQAEFDEWGPGAGVGERPPQKLIPPTPGGNHPLMDWGTWPHEDQDRGDWQVASWAVEQLESPPKEPFFLACGFFLPHVPCYAPPKWFEMYPNDSLVMPPILRDDRDDVPDFAWYLHWKLPEPRLSWLQKEDQWRPLVRAYLASISFVDGQVGRVLDALDESGEADNTIVVLWSDHGWHLGEKGISGKNTVWERSARVPLIFAGPGVAQGARCNQPAELLDMYPTLSDLCGLPAPKGLDGHSLVPQLKNAAAPREWPAITTHNPGNHGIRSERWRYIHYADGSEELYDIEADPHEWTNLAGDARHAAVLAEHRRWLPEQDANPVPGSNSRLLDQRDGRWYWENEPIDPADLEK
jgi:choline-sulfatase